ncbi:hypothetical protein ADK70_31945 [Streptomyces rimosus subsp. pseudoverticillatus]|uniref:hypothetical protein n=1 Tax=Streptomyces rimosus TaxID=1927 RepID=UPI0006B27660|nr:hypothetical protein [Streptomyces rimosus]KOT79122.1 hypothetical protein ADK70_31945 [Streptomyces rimosus subsp. pseudoverticillatus]
MTHTTALAVAEHIEALYGRPLAELEAHVDAQQTQSMLAALLGIHAGLLQAERNIDHQLGHLRELTQPGREVGASTAGAIFDCARRLATSVATREAHTQAATTVLNSLRRAAPPQATAPGPQLPPASAAAHPLAPTR